LRKVEKGRVEVVKKNGREMAHKGKNIYYTSEKGGCQEFMGAMN